MVILSFLVMILSTGCSHSSNAINTIDSILNSHDINSFQKLLNEPSVDGFQSSLTLQLNKLPPDYTINYLASLYNNKDSELLLREKSLCALLVIAKNDPLLYSHMVSNLLDDALTKNDRYSLEILEEYYDFIFPPLDSLSPEMTHDFEKLFYKNLNNPNPIFNLVFYQYPIDKIEQMLPLINKAILPELLISIDKMEKRNGNKDYYATVKKMIEQQMQINKDYKNR